jgi:hypothetical protein
MYNVVTQMDLKKRAALIRKVTLACLRKRNTVIVIIIIIIVINHHQSSFTIRRASFDPFVEYIAQFIIMAEELRKIGNLNGVFAVVAGLRSAKFRRCR